MRHSPGVCPSDCPVTVLLLCAGVVAAALGAGGCDWKTPQPTTPTTVYSTTVEMQDQHGEPLGSKTLTNFADSPNILTYADVGNGAAVSHKYLALRLPPSSGKIGEGLFRTSEGSLQFVGNPDMRSVVAIYMSTVDVPEQVMDCFYNSGFGQSPAYVSTKTTIVAKIRPGAPDAPPGVTILDGDDSIVKNAIDDIDSALVDRQGVELGKVTWQPDYPAHVFAGFATRSMVYFDDYGRPYVLVNPVDSPGQQSVDALGGLLQAWGGFTQQPCGIGAGSYLADAASDYRLSKQGVAIIRFGAYLMGVRR